MAANATTRKLKRAGFSVHRDGSVHWSGTWAGDHRNWMIIDKLGCPNTSLPQPFGTRLIDHYTTLLNLPPNTLYWVPLQTEDQS